MIGSKLNQAVLTVYKGSVSAWQVLRLT